ncbi:uncharacterized protein KY384_008294 [Bacidia gigantensis]|uniref:uncharacterized protein n=1 Tax=Bacidia gigantensis TaxID=2732470 RepID=UPI001D03E032|nr:uncharacterized protein KY384_008294 [Bacidia gigantensis]KAG8526865.1 hypothetical protein KY384_008294 [Bacidia gigantensis]
MESPSEGNSYDSSEQIKQLGEIDKHVVQLLKSAGHALETLTSTTASSDSRFQGSVNLAESRTTFSGATSQYFNSLRFIDIQLREQISALEKAAILRPQDTASTTQTDLAIPTSIARSMGIVNPLASKADGRKGAVAAGGLGSLDVGWLNSRNDNVGKEMEAELWEEALGLVKSFEVRRLEEQKQQNQRKPAKPVQQDGAHESMDEG